MTPFFVHFIMFNFFSALAGLGLAFVLGVVNYRALQTLGKLSVPEAEEEHEDYLKAA